MIRILCRRLNHCAVEPLAVEQLPAAVADQNNIIWIDLSLTSEQVSQAADFLKAHFEFHPLALEDALLESHLARVDDWQKYLYMVFHAIGLQGNELQQHELDIFLGINYLVTIHFDVIEPLNKLWENCSRIKDDRTFHSADRLLYHLLDKITTATMQVVESLDDTLDELEQQIYARPRKEQLAQVFRARRTVLQLRRMFGSQREAMNRLARDPFLVVQPENRVYFRDIYDENPNHSYRVVHAAYFYHRLFWYELFRRSIQRG
ncbi:MAG TPA: CorA family divalent cation transporter [Gemmatales bacterium]|nr:CorA family divalent cation transporter [Gemmatales bacterium]